MDDASLFTTGRDWVYTYPTDAGNRHIIGHDVEFVDCLSKELVVKLDSNTELNVPVSIKNFLVDSSGFHDVELELTGIAVGTDMIKAVVEASN